MYHAEHATRAQIVCYQLIRQQSRTAAVLLVTMLSLHFSPPLSPAGWNRAVFSVSPKWLIMSMSNIGTVAAPRVRRRLEAKAVCELCCPWKSTAIPAKLQSSGWKSLQLRLKNRRRNGIVVAAGRTEGIRKASSKCKVPTHPAEWLLIAIGVSYLTLMIIIPTANVFYQAFCNGIQPFIVNLLDPDFQHAVKMTLTVASIVVPLNTFFGLTVALWVTRHDFPGKALLLSFIDLPFSISPVVTGLMLMLLYGREGVFAPLLRALNIEIVFALPGMVLATAFVTIPFVVREVIPVLLEMDIYEEEAARTMGANEWEVFWDVTLPNIRLGLLYGITLCNARAMGEFGAVSVISGNIIGKTQTLTLFVESAYKEYNTQGAFSAAVLLSMLALVTLFIKSKLEELREKETAR